MRHRERISSYAFGYASDRALRTDRLADAETARARARQWLSAFRAAGLLASITE
jgi:hypothetical protein